MIIDHWGNFYYGYKKNFNYLFYKTNEAKWVKLPYRGISTITVLEVQLD